MFNVSTENEIAIGGIAWIFTIVTNGDFDKLKPPVKMIYNGRFSNNNKYYLSFIVDGSEVETVVSDTPTIPQNDLKVKYIEDYPNTILETPSHIVAKTRSGIFDKISSRGNVSKKLIFLKRYREYCIINHPEWFI